KASVVEDEDVLAVRGYLPVDESNPDTDSGKAYPFGEFRFSGCRKVVTALSRSQMASLDDAFAPRDTRFDGMWFAETGPGLTMLDGSLPPRYDIPVLGGTASAFRLLPPHQDLRFEADRPFFYMDDRRAFVVSSTGSSGTFTNPLDWVVADVATLGMATADGPSPGGTTEVPPGSS